jgi:hypothetical protein
MRERQARLLLEINSLVAEIRDASSTTIEDLLALLDVALEHELDLASDIAFYGPVARTAPGFEFNSLRRWLSCPGEFEQLMGHPTLWESAANDPGTVEPIGFDDPKILPGDCSPQREQKGAGTGAQIRSNDSTLSFCRMG